MIQSAPLLTIILPVYNVAPYLFDCLSSIVNQTYYNLEIIIVDDGSTDETGNICDRFAAKDHRIRVFHQENAGIAHARNRALQDVHGEYIGFVDGDDWLDTDMYEMLYRNMITYNVDISICAHYIETDFGTVKKINTHKILRLNQEEALKELMKDDVVRNYVWDKLFKTSLCKDLYFPEGRMFGDMFFTTRAFLKAQSFVMQCTPKYHYVSRKSSIVHGGYHYIKEYHHLLSLQDKIELSIKYHIPTSNKVYCKALRKSIHCIDHLATFPHSPELDEIHSHALRILHQYDKLNAFQIGFGFAFKRFLIFHFPNFYSKLYFVFRKIWKSKPMERAMSLQTTHPSSISNTDIA